LRAVKRENGEHSRRQNPAIEAGKPVVKVTALSAPVGAQVRRLGFMAGQISVPDDFDRMGSKEIERIFDGGA
jgi:hypothetical protein